MAAIKDVQLGRMNFMTLVGADSAKESVGDQLDVQGAIVGAGDPQPRGFMPKLPIRASITDSNPQATAKRMRRQIRAYMENDIARLQGVYFKWSVDPELNGWLLLGRADIAAGPGGGITMTDWELDISDGYLIGNPRTHRPARTLRSWDRRLSTTPRDFLGTLYSTDFASQTGLPLHFLPVGVSDALGTGRTVLSATVRQAREGALSYLASQTDGQVVNYEQDETYRALSWALIYDRRGVSDYMSTATVPASVETDLTGWASSPSSYSAYRTEVVADSPVSYWRLGEPSGTTAADVQGVNAGTYVNAPTLGVAGTTNDGDTAITLNGTSQYVNVPDAASLRITGDITLEAWVKPTDRSGFFFIIAKGGGGGATNYEWRLENGTGIPNFFGNTTGPVSGTTAPPTGVWSHIAVKRSGTTVTHYLNGATNGTGTLATSTDTGAPLRIGTRNDLFNYFKGSIDEPAVYNTALSTARILAHYNAATTGTVTPLSQSSAWAAAGTKSARWQISGAASIGATLDSPSFAVQAGATITPWIDYKINTITGGNLALSVHWSDGSSSPIATLTVGSTSPSYATTAGLVAPGGVTSYTIRATPSAAGTYDVAFDIPLGVPGAPTRAQVLAANGISGSPQDDLGWEEVYGPNQPLTANDVPVLDNGIGRVRYQGAGVFAVDGWLTGNGYLELGRFEIWRDYPAGTVTQFTTLVNAAVIEWSEERAVIRATFSGPDQSSRADVYLTLQRGWLGPRIEAYGSWTGGQAMGIAIRLVPANTGASTLGRSSGTTTIVDGTDHGTFGAIENWLYLTQVAAGSLALHAAVLQNGVRCIGRADTTAYGTSRNGVAVTARYGDAVAGYVSAQLGWGPTASAATDAQQLGQTALYDCRQLPELVGR